MVYPKEALEKQLEGIVYLNAEINDNGYVEQTRIAKGLGSGSDEEVIRLIKNIIFTSVRNK